MNTVQKMSLAVLRLGMGWLFLYAGVTKIINPAWSAEGYLRGAKTFPGLFAWFASPDVLPLTNFLNEWGLTLIGVALILGLFVRIASVAGIILMALYYFPILDFPYPNPHSYLIDEHVIYGLAFFALAAFRAGRAFGLEKWCVGLPICRRFPAFRNLLG